MWSGVELFEKNGQNGERLALERVALVAQQEDYRAEEDAGVVGDHSSRLGSTKQVLQHCEALLGVGRVLEVDEEGLLVELEQVRAKLHALGKWLRAEARLHCRH